MYVLTLIHEKSKFQFQHGAIKSAQGEKRIIEHALFQFQHGAIKRKSTRSNIRSNDISIPTWCD